MSHRNVASIIDKSDPASKESLGRQIDDINAVKPQDLEITKEGGEVVISFAYRKEIPLFANVGVYMDFAASSKGTEKAGN